MYITLPNKNFKSSDITLADILGTMKKADMLKICKKLDLYVSPNLRKDETARRLADEMLEYPEAVLCALSKTELQHLNGNRQGWSERLRISQAAQDAVYASKTRTCRYMRRGRRLADAYARQGA